MKEVSVQELQLNPMTLIAKEWMLVTAGTQERGYNTMTCSWGHLGPVWASDTTIAYVRPQRYTKQFLDEQEYFTLTFSPEQYRKQLQLCGTKSGRDMDTVKECGFTLLHIEQGAPYFDQAELVLVCRKLYRAPRKAEGFLGTAVMEKCYPERDFHDLYVGRIVKVLAAE
mgnify:CR=1 FL=1